MKRELESALEDRCVKRIESLGGQALKLVIPGVRGFPDRTILMPGRQIWMAEFKRIKSGRVSAQQGRWGEALIKLGFPVYFIDTDADFEAALAWETRSVSR